MRQNEVFGSTPTCLAAVPCPNIANSSYLCHNCGDCIDFLPQKEHPHGPQTAHLKGFSPVCDFMCTPGLGQMCHPCSNSINTGRRARSIEAL